MKYIVILAKVGTDDLGKIEIPIIFPSYLVHYDVYESMCHQITVDNGYTPIECVAAGEVNLFEGIVCHGHSDTLNVSSRGKQDEILIKMYDYAGGWV